MLQLLTTFAALTLLTSIVLSLLPEGSLRSAAAMVAGVMLLLTWSRGVLGLLDVPFALPDAPSTVLTATGSTLSETAQQAAAALGEAVP
ncbi:MAG: hypothetical protein ACI4MG_10440 [Aristaeellaceae bacterium]